MVGRTGIIRARRSAPEFYGSTGTSEYAELIKFLINDNLVGTRIQDRVLVQLREFLWAVNRHIGSHIV